MQKSLPDAWVKQLRVAEERMRMLVSESFLNNNSPPHALVEHWARLGELTKEIIVFEAFQNNKSLSHALLQHWAELALESS